MTDQAPPSHDDESNSGAEKSEKHSKIEEQIGLPLRQMAKRIETLIAEVRTEHESDRRDRQKYEEQESDRLRVDTRWSRILSGFTLGVGVLTLWVLHKTYGVYSTMSDTYSTQATIMATQAVIMDKQRQLAEKTLPAVEAATESAKAAERANQLAREAERPYVWFTNTLGVPEFITPNASGLGQIVWTWHFTNYGRSPAYDFRCHQFMKLGNEPFSESFGETKPIIGAPLPPGKDDFLTVVSPPVAPQEFNQLMATDSGIAIRLVVDYSDGEGIKHISQATLSHLRSGAISYSDTEIK